MKSLLLINASPYGQHSHASQLVLEWVASLRRQHPGLELIERNLSTEPLPPIDVDYAHALTSAELFASPVFKVSEELIGELERSDILLITTPMHNFTVPAALKLWIDYVLRIHRTFNSTPKGKIGLLRDRPVHVLVSSGGFHRAEQARQPDFLTPYLRQVLNTLGLFNLRFTYLEGLAFDDDAVLAAVEGARTSLWQDQSLDRHDLARPFSHTEC